MTVSRIQSQPNPDTSARPLSKPRPQGLAQTPDRLEDRMEVNPEGPPSFFKEFLIKPVFQMGLFLVKFMFKGIFTFIDFLREFALEEKSVHSAKDREAFLDTLRSTPSPETILHQFSRTYSKAEQNRVYRGIGEAHKPKVSWKEVIWDRSNNENIELGQRLVRQNPFLLRDPLSNP